MAKYLPYRATTSSGNQFDFKFPLHEETAAPVAVANLLSAVLGALDREIRLIGQVANGDVLQALAMALTVRTRMLPGDAVQLETLVGELVQTALAAPVMPAEGNLSPAGDRNVH